MQGRIIRQISNLYTVKVGDILTFKKNHPCGGSNWKVLRIGVDWKLECTTCGRVIMIPRVDVMKRIKNK